MTVSQGISSRSAFPGRISTSLRAPNAGLEMFTLLWGNRNTGDKVYIDGDFIGTVTVNFDT